MSPTSFAATIDGETVIDIWGGHKDKDKTSVWEEDTIVNVYSSTKTMASLVMLMLADRGEIDFHEKVSKYWPEFAQNGKEGVEVRHIMSHSAGLSGLDEPVRGLWFGEVHPEVLERFNLQNPAILLEANLDYLGIGRL